MVAGEPTLHFDCFDGPELVNDQVLEELLPFALYLQNVDLNGSSVSSTGEAKLLEHREPLERSDGHAT